MQPESNDSFPFCRFLLADHVRLKGCEVPARMEAAQFGDGGIVLFYPAFLGHRQSQGTAEQVGGLLLNFGKQGVQHRGEALTAEVCECEARLPGSGFCGVQAKGGGRAGHLFQYAGICEYRAGTEVAVRPSGNSREGDR